MSAKFPEDVISWSENRTLQFSDFKGEYNKEENRHSKKHGMALIRHTIRVTPSNVKDTIYFKVSACMDRNASWFKNANDTISLIHEQGHWDICEIYARELRRDITKAKSKKEAKIIWSRAIKKLAKEESKYDKYNSGISSGITEEWKKIIATRLEELDDYRNENVYIIVP